MKVRHLGADTNQYYIYMYIFLVCLHVFEFMYLAVRRFSLNCWCISTNILQEVITKISDCETTVSQLYDDGDVGEMSVVFRAVVECIQMQAY